MNDIKAQTYVEGKKDKSEWIMKIGNYEFPVEEKCFLLDNCGFDTMGFSAPTLKFSAQFKSEKYAEKVCEILQNSKIGTVQLIINDGYVLEGKIAHCISLCKWLYIFVRFI